MERKILRNPPLVEAIFELRWELQIEQPGIIKKDPHYKILIGGIYNKVREEYPFHEQLSAATIPDEIVGYVVQHRFRKDKDKWPLIQIGPGIITLNDTEEYSWDGFQKKISSMLNVLFDVYPDSEKKLKVNELLLRYIDAIDFDYENNSVFNFLVENMKTNIELQEELFDVTRVGKLPSGFDLRFSFPSTEPNGIMQLRFARGKRKEVDALIWETALQLMGTDIPNTQGEIIAWVDEAHTLVHNWFFKVIEGKLERMFE